MSSPSSLAFSLRVDGGHGHDAAFTRGFKRGISPRPLSDVSGAIDLMRDSVRLYLGDAEVTVDALAVLRCASLDDSEALGYRVGRELVGKHADSQRLRTQASPG